MDYERNDTPQGEEWIDDVLGESPLQSELGPDEHAVHSAGLIHPDDMELEMILAEHREEETDPDEPFDFDVPVFDEAVYSSEEQEALCEELSSDETQIFLPEEARVLHRRIPPRHRPYPGGRCRLVHRILLRKRKSVSRP